MTLDALSSCLHELERVNARGVGSYTYQLSGLSNVVPLLEAVVQELVSRGSYQERWPIELLPLQEAWRLQVEELIEQWVFVHRENANGSLVQAFSDQLMELFPDCTVFEILGEGTMLPAVIWNALVITNGRENWLLEFGWSD